jgi:hypothetical protein
MLRKLYKLTDENMCTYNNTQWVLGEWKETDGEQQRLCTDSWLHAYESPFIAVLMNPDHRNFTNPRLFEAEGDGYYLDDNGLKCGVSKLRLVKEIPLPVVTNKQKDALIQKIYYILYKKDYPRVVFNQHVCDYLTQYACFCDNKNYFYKFIEDVLEGSKC